jgi:hypothetical protein
MTMAPPQPTPDAEVPHYSAKTCGVHPSCLDCPELVCWYDAPPETRIPLKTLKNLWVVDRLLNEEELTAQQIKDRTGINVRVVYRLLAMPRPARVEGR